MSTFDVDREEIIMFEVDDMILFKQYFDQDELFQTLKQYYNSDKYRFEVPQEDVSELYQILDNYFYHLNIVTNFEPYCVVQEKQADSSDILRNAVTFQYQGQYEIFLMKDELSANQAIEKGASTTEKSDVAVDEIKWEIGRS